MATSLQIRSGISRQLRTLVDSGRFREALSLYLETCETETPSPECRLLAGKAAASTAITLIAEAHQDGLLKLPPRELPWLNRIRETVAEMPDKEGDFIAEMQRELDSSKFVAADYGL